MRSTFLWLFVTTLTLTAGVAGADTGPNNYDFGEPVALHEARHGSLLLRTSHPGAFLEAPGLTTDVSIQVTGMIARAQVRQRFHNPTGLWLEGVYVFPLPEDAAVDGLQMVVGERVIVGEIHERQAAKKVYEQAKVEGKKASLVEQERPNVFTTSVANIGPDEEIDVVIEYQQDLRYDHGRFSLRFPMVVAPRYIPGAPLAETVRPVAGSFGAADAILPAAFSGLGRVADTDQVPDASRITPPVVGAGEDAINPVFLQIELDAGVPLAWLDSPSHALHVERGAGSSYVIELDDAVVPADRDFVIEWEPETGSAPRAAIFTQEHEGETYALLMVLPPRGDDAGAVRLPRETVIVIDTSGSMGGESIIQARKALLVALDHLRPEDHFNVIEFNSVPAMLFAGSVPASDDNLERARHWVGGLRARGGTEIRAALDVALDGQERDLGVRQVIFVTDGSVGNERALFEHIRRRLGKSRLFTVGIGSAPNSHFMRRAAEHGRGTFTYVNRVDEVARRMGELFDKLESPVLHDVEVVWDDPSAETWPARVGDLYLGEPIQVATRLPGGGAGVKVSGWRDEAYWARELPLKDVAREVGIDKLWARKKIASLTASLADGADPAQIRDEVVALALRHHLVSEHTSLVAVDTTPTAPAGVRPETRMLPVNLPAGWATEHAIATLPKGGTPARLFILIGILALLASAVLTLVRPQALPFTHARR